MRGLFVQVGLAVCVALSGAFTTISWAQAKAEVFSRLDQSARSFKGATANISVITHTEPIDKDDTQIGTFIVKRTSPSEFRFLINFSGKDAQAIALQGRTFEIYYPKLNIVREFDIGKYKDVAQKLILLGFGMTGRELAANYDVNILGNERLESQDSVHLQLTPRAVVVLRQLSRADLWISLKTNCPVQQKFYLPGGDYRLVTYSDFKPNPPLPASALDLPKAAKRERVN